MSDDEGDTVIYNWPYTIFATCSRCRKEMEFTRQATTLSPLYRYYRCNKCHKMRSFSATAAGATRSNG